MTEFVQITTTTGKRQDAEQIAAELVSQRLAACVQVSGPIGSTFRWEGKTETLEEWMCTIKTTSAKRAAIEAVFKSLHPYKAPEFVVTPIAGGSSEYLAWIEAEVG
jgi:periplasmic divalent cation tolerance protein